MTYLEKENLLLKRQVKLLTLFGIFSWSAFIFWIVAHA